MDREKLTSEVRCELDHLRRTAAQAERLLALPAAERREWDAVAAAKYVADLWLGLENLCKRRYAALGQLVPFGADSHTRVLEDFLAEPALGGALPAALVVRLKKYLAFRHRFAHGYGQEITWPMVEEPLRLLPETLDLLVGTWEGWLSSLPDDR